MRSALSSARNPASTLCHASRRAPNIASAGYFHRYAEVMQTEDLHAQTGYVDGVAAIAIFRPATSPSPAYFILLESRDGRVNNIRDFRYVPYIATDATFSVEAQV